MFLGGAAELILPSPRALVGSLFPLSAPDTNGVILFCRDFQSLQREESTFQVINQLCSCNLRTPPWCLTLSLLCASCVKHQDNPTGTLDLFCSLCPFSVVHKPLMGREAPRFSELNSRSFKNLLFYMKDLTLSTCWVFLDQEKLFSYK